MATGKIRSRNNKKWVHAEDQLLREMYSDNDFAVIAKRLNRTRSSVRNRASQLGLKGKGGKAWSQEELRRLKEFYAAHKGGPISLDPLVQEFSRIKGVISRKASKLGLTEPIRSGFDSHDDYLRHRRKYDTPEDLSRALRRKAVEWHKKNEHPKGMFGKNHTPKARKKMSASQKKRQENMSREEQERITTKAIKTKMKKYGHAGAVYKRPSNAYSRCNGGKREDLGNQYFRSSWEANIARYLNWLVDNGEIASWKYEPDRFVFDGETRGAITYTPDFKVFNLDGSYVYWEVKGWMDSNSKSRLRKMAKFYPDEPLEVIGEERYKAIGKWSSVIPGWE